MPTPRTRLSSRGASTQSCVDLRYHNLEHPLFSNWLLPSLLRKHGKSERRRHSRGQAGRLCRGRREPQVHPLLRWVLARPPGGSHPCLCARGLFRDDWAVSKGRGEQADGRESLRLDASYFCERAWVDGFRGKRRVGASRRLSPRSDLHPGLTGPERLAGPGSRPAGPVPLGDNHPDPRPLGVRRGGEGGAAASGCLPATGPVELQTLVFEQACGGGLGVRVSE